MVTYFQTDISHAESTKNDWIQKEAQKAKELDEQGIEPWTTSNLELVRTC